MRVKLCKKLLAVMIIFSISLCITGIAGGNRKSLGDLSDVKKDIACDVFEFISKKAHLDIDKPSNLPYGYAGAYLGKDGILNLCVTKDAQKLFDTILDDIPYEIISDEYVALSQYEQDLIKKEMIKVSISKFSYEELYRIQETLGNVMKKYGIVETDLIQSKNCVEVYVRDEKTIPDIRAYLQECLGDYALESIQFIVTDVKIEVKTKYAYGGVKIYPFLSVLSAGSVGFSASYVDSQGTVHYGIVTNAHVAEALDIMKLSISETVGNTILSTVNSTTDVAFVEFNSGWDRTTRLQSASGQDIWEVASSSYLLEGSPTKKYGQVSGKTSGTVQSVSTRVLVDGYSFGEMEFTDVFKISNTTAKGDSGGPIGRAAAKQMFRLLGITFAGPSDESYGFGIKYSHINELGITAFTVQ